MHTPARFKILKELKELKGLLQNLSCSCENQSSNSTKEDVNNSDLLLTLHLLQLIIMIGLVVALMCNFYSLKEPSWKDIAMKAVAFGAIVTFWPIYLLVISVMTCYSKCFREEEEKVKNFKDRYMSNSGPTINKSHNGVGIASRAKPIFSGRRRRTKMSIPAKKMWQSATKKVLQKE